MKNRIALLLTGVIAATVLAGCGNSAPVDRVRIMV
jgi:outer membrane murein-binding lipoprotein Lpp